MGPVLAERELPLIKRIPEKDLSERIFVEAIKSEPVTIDGREMIRDIYGRKDAKSKLIEPYFFIYQRSSNKQGIGDFSPVVEIDPAEPTRYKVRSIGDGKLDSIVTTATRVSLDVEKGTEVGTVIAGHPDSDITVHAADAVIATYGGQVRLVEKADVTLSQGGKIDARTAASGRAFITTGGEMIIGDALQVSLIGSPKSQATVHFLQDSFVDRLIRGGNTMVSLPMFSHLDDFIGKSIIEGQQNRVSENILDEPVVVRPTGLAGFGESPSKPQQRTFMQAASYPEGDNDIATRLFYTDILTSRIEPFWESYLGDYAHKPERSGRVALNVHELYRTDPEKAMEVYRKIVAANDAAEAKIRALADIEDPDPRQRRMYEEQRPRDETFRGVRAPDDPTVRVRREEQESFLKRVKRYFEREEAERLGRKYVPPEEREVQDQQVEEQRRGRIAVVESVVLGDSYLMKYLHDAFATAGIAPKQETEKVAQILTFVLNNTDKTPPKGTKIRRLTPEGLQILAAREKYPDLNQLIINLFDNPDPAQQHLNAYKHVSDIARVNADLGMEILSRIHRIANAHRAAEEAEVEAQRVRENQEVIAVHKRSMQRIEAARANFGRREEVKIGEIVEPRWELGERTLRYRTPDGTIYIARPDAGSPYPEVRVVETENGHQVLLASERPLKEVLIQGAADIDARQVSLIKRLTVEGGTIDTGSVQNLSLVGTATVHGNLEGESKVVGRSRLVVRGELDGQLRIFGPEETVSDIEQQTEPTQLPTVRQVMEKERQRREEARMRRIIATGERRDTDSSTVLINRVTHRGRLALFGRTDALIEAAKAEQIVFIGDQAKAKLVHNIDA